jgi:Na+/H+ antiporter NhaD/arsenite permease-like protein
VTPLELHSQGVTWQMWLAGAILFVTYIFIFSEKIHRTSAAIIGAVVMIGFGLWAGFYSQTAAIQAIDGNTILLLAGMMMMVAMLRATGAMQYAAIRMAKLSGHHPKLLFIYLCALVSVISMFLDNVTTIVIFAPLTILITRIMNLNPQPYLMAEAMLSNIGGVATLV